MGQTEPGVSDRPLPLAGYRILSAEQYGAGPYGTMFLAQLGAEVIMTPECCRNGTERCAAAAEALGLADDTRDVLFDCTTSGGPEFSDAKITIYGGSHNGSQYDGHLSTANVEAEIDVYDGLDALTAIHIGDGFALNYTIHLSDLTYEVTASGNKFGFARGACTMDTAAE